MNVLINKLSALTHTVLCDCILHLLKFGFKFEIILYCKNAENNAPQKWYSVLRQCHNTRRKQSSLSKTNIGCGQV